MTLKNDKTLPIKSSNCGEEANLGRELQCEEHGKGAQRCRAPLNTGRREKAPIPGSEGKPTRGGQEKGA